MLQEFPPAVLFATLLVVATLAATHQVNVPEFAHADYIGLGRQELVYKVTTLPWI
jgi:hypothetical protein